MEDGVVEVCADGSYDLSAQAAPASTPAGTANPPVAPARREEPGVASASPTGPAPPAARAEEAQDPWVERKERGNKAVTEGKLGLAVEHYSAALMELQSSGGPSAPGFEATVLSNRALVWLKMVEARAAGRGDPGAPSDQDLHTKCVEDCNAVLERSPGHPKALFRKSKALYGLGELHQALSVARQAKKAWTSSKEAAAWEAFLRSEESFREAEVAATAAGQHAAEGSVDNPDAVGLAAATAFLRALGGGVASIDSERAKDAATAGGCRAVAAALRARNRGDAEVAAGVASAAARIAGGGLADLLSGASPQKEGDLEVVLRAGRAARKALEGQAVDGVERACAAACLSVALGRTGSRGQAFPLVTSALVQGLGFSQERVRQLLAALGRGMGNQGGSAEGGANPAVAEPDPEFDALLDGLDGEAREGVRQILQMSDAQVEALPPEQRAQVEQIRDMRRQHADFVKQQRAAKENQQKQPATPRPSMSKPEKDETRWLREHSEKLSKLLASASQANLGMSRAEWEAARAAQEAEKAEAQAAKDRARSEMAEKVATELAAAEAVGTSASEKDPLRKIDRVQKGSSKRKKNKSKRDKERQVADILKLAQSAPKTNFLE
eukprot:CAMPEP_0118979042 /NCGR_PEP_ID=MMETSP1173-20130426/25039_1 /TAXON_ID=1034831 /ORGANISM="Rhizochromulina marina cf, Strain CCMP1243" /LENGTH=612 /DNA_ID=CAMNT_0006929283 /DNA_START=23 /DNA_END=1861 /DNA_ORIENTATION=+